MALTSDRALFPNNFVVDYLRYIAGVCVITR